MTMLSLLHIRLPEPVLLAADFMGRGNGFLAMLLVGVSMDLRLDVSSLGEVIRILAVRYIFIPTGWASGRKSPVR